MSEKPDTERRLWRFFVMAHGLAFAGLWVAGMYELVAYPYMISKWFAPVALLLTPIFLLHIGAYAYYVGRRNSGERERQAYREGVADTLRQLGEHFPERMQRLSINDEEDSWMAEEPRKQKRSG